MGVYVLADGHGSYICNSCGKFVPIRGFKYAEQWDSYEKAERILNNQIAKVIRSSYEVQLVNTEQTVEKDNEKQKELCSREVDDENISSWLEKVDSIKDVLSGQSERRDELNGLLSDVDKEIVDIEHYIEFGKFNCYQGWMCFKMLQNALKRRRQYKRELEVLRLIENCKINTTQMVALSAAIKDIQNQRYKPRKLPELFRGNSKLQ